MDNDLDIAALSKAVEEAHRELLEANQRYSKASQEQTIAVNRANEAQRAFERAIEAMKKQAPYGSDWTRKPGTPIE